MFRTQLLITCLCLWFLSFSNATAQGIKRPSAERLLPQDTVVFVQIPSIEVLKEDFSKTGFGRMTSDVRIAPLINQLYDELAYLFETQVQEYVGVGLDEILSLPTGEICFAVVAPKRESPALVLLLDVNETSDTADILLERGRQAAEDAGASFSSEPDDHFEIDVVQRRDGDHIFFVRHEGTLLVCNNREVLNDMLLRWIGNPPANDQTLKDNRKYITIMNRCASVHEGRGHQISFFIDPFELINSSLRGEAQRLFVLGLLRTAGLDGLLAIGGTSLFDELGYESILHLHVSLSNPRKGVFKVLALKPGKYLPEPWVADDVLTYWTSNWDVNDVYQQIQGIYESYEPETDWNDLIEQNISTRFKIDFDEDIVAAMSGRVTYVTWNEPPSRFNSQSNVLSLGLKDPDQFRDTVLTAIERILDENGMRDRLEIVDYKGIKIWQAAVDDEQAERRRMRMEDEGLPFEIRVPQPCMAIIGDSLVITESPRFLEHAIDTFVGDVPPLVDDLRYAEVMREMTKLLKTDLPGMTIFSRPDLQFQNLFELADDEAIRDFLRQQAEDVEIAGGVLGVLEKNPLPAFDELAGYFAPTGAFLTNDESGWHLLFFQIKAERAR